MNTKQDGHIFGTPLDTVSKLVKSKFVAAFRDQGTDVTSEQWVILSNLYDHDGQSQNELAAKSYKNAPTVSRIIDLLVKKNYLRRQMHGEDRRSFQIFLTPQGRKVVEQLFPVAKELRIQGWKNLSEKDYQDLIRILNQISANFEML